MTPILWIYVALINEHFKFNNLSFNALLVPLIIFIGLCGYGILFLLHFHLSMLMKQQLNAVLADRLVCTFLFCVFFLSICFLIVFFMLAKSIFSFLFSVLYGFLRVLFSLWFLVVWSISMWCNMARVCRFYGKISPLL